MRPVLSASSVRRRASTTAPQQQHLHARREDRITRVDGVLTIAPLVRQADLPEIGMALLGTVEVGHPDARPMAGQHLGHHAGGAAVTDHMDHHLVVLEHPVPVGPAGDAHRGLIEADDAAAAQSGEDRCDLGVEARLGAAASSAPSLIRKANNCRNSRVSRW